ncbi:MAG: hypothetical protein FWE06_03700, partial [Oscillospiraceae bacterium]|nr:hypothetical protein [Oscillospiraceae bacterium]
MYFPNEKRKKRFYLLSVLALFLAINLIFVSFIGTTYGDNIINSSDDSDNAIHDDYELYESDEVESEFIESEISEEEVESKTELEKNDLDGKQTEESNENDAGHDGSIEDALSVESRDEALPGLLRASLTVHDLFTQEEIDDPRIWYARETNYRIVEIAPTPANTIYTRVLNAITAAATANTVTYVIIPSHINTGNVGAASRVEVRSGATVVLVGRHSETFDLDARLAAGEITQSEYDATLLQHRSYEPGQIVLTDTSTNATGHTRPFMVRSANNANNDAAHDDIGEPGNPNQFGLVIRNFVMQYRATAVGQGAPAVPPAPIDWDVTAIAGFSGGGVAIEPRAAGNTGGHFIMCRGAVIRNAATNNSGATDVQRGGRLTLMPGSLIHSNHAQAAGGAVHVRGAGALIMYGGTLRDNIARGAGGNNFAQTGVRGNGGAVNLGQDATMARFVMFDGVLEGNTARNAGGAINIGTDGSEHGQFIMYNGVIRNNRAIGTVIDASVDRTTTRSNGGAVSIRTGGTFTMHDGVISGNYAGLTVAADPGATGNLTATVVSNGGGVFAQGTNAIFNMYGGEISGNRAERVRVSNLSNVVAGNGGGVFVANGATFNMGSQSMQSTGVIRDNIATAAVTGHSAVTANNARNTSNGGGVFVSGANSTFNMNGGRVEGNAAIRVLNSSATGVDVFAGNGGGVYIANGGRGNMTNGLIIENQAAAAGSPFNFNLENGSANMANGGGVFVSGENSHFTMRNGRIESNHTENENIATGSTVAGNGGAVYAADGGTFTVEDGMIAENRATSTEASFQRGNGGGVFVRGGIVNLRGGHIVNHVVSRNGGGMFISRGTANVSDGVIVSGNHSETNGGGIAVECPAFADASTQASILNIADGGIVRDNTARSDGGGVWVSGAGSRFDMSGGVIEGNTSTDIEANGGGVYIGDDASATMSGGEICMNTAWNGGGMALDDGRFIMSGGTIEQNCAPMGGGVNMANATIFNMSGGRIRNNRHARTDPVTGAGTGTITEGSGVRVNGASSVFTMTGGIIGDENPDYGNRALRGGGVVVVNGARFVMEAGGTTTNPTSGRVVGNEAVGSTTEGNAQGGGIYVMQNSSFSGTVGSIADNTAGDGGGVFVPHTNLNLITIGQDFTFTGNMARNGLRIDTPIAVANPQVEPGTTTIEPWWEMDVSGNGVERKHAFTNHDINAEGPGIFRVKYNVRPSVTLINDGGDIDAYIGKTRLPNDVYVLENTTVRFEATPYGDDEHQVYAWYFNSDNDFTNLAGDPPGTSQTWAFPIVEDSHVVVEFEVAALSFLFQKTGQGIYNVPDWETPGWIASVLRSGARFSLYRYT